MRFTTGGARRRSDTSATDEVLLVVGAAAARVHRVLRIRAQRARAHDLLLLQLARHEAVGRLPGADPRVDRRGPVDGIGPGSTAAVQYAGPHEGTAVVS